MPIVLLIVIIHRFSPRIVSVRRQLLLPLIAYLSCLPVYADDTAETIPLEPIDKDADYFFSTYLIGMEKTRDSWSERWVDFAEGVDRYFSDQQHSSDTTNKSFIKLQFKQSFFERGGTETDMRIKAKFDLPNTQRRTKLFFSSNEYSDDSLEERVLSNSTGERLRRENSVSGLEITPDSEWHNWKRSARIGLKLRSQLVPFARYRMRRTFSTTGVWQAKFSQEFWYFHDLGWGETSEFSIHRPLNDRWKLNLWTVLEFEDQNDFFEALQVVSFTQNLGEKATLEYRSGILGSNENRSQVTGYFTGMHYSLGLHEDWVFLTVSPEVFFPKEENWNQDVSITFKLDVYFSS